MKNNLRKISYILIMLIMLFCLTKVYAVTENELNEQLENIDAQINSTSTEIAGLKTQMTANLEQINRINIQIAEYEDEIQSTTKSIESIQSVLEGKKEELKVAEENYNKQKNLLEKRLIAMYESSQTTYLDLLLGAADLSDFISKYYLVQEIAEYDKKAIRLVENTKKVVESQENEISKKNDILESTKERLTIQVDSMEVLIKDKTNLIEELTEEERALEIKLSEYEEDKKQIEKELAELAKANSIKASLTPSECGYISPLIGKTRKNITTGFYGYSGHTGVDFAVVSGTEIMAVKDGTVAISDAKKNSSGYYRSYGEYVVIDHHDGTMTLYAHGLPNSRKVEVGDEVVAGQTIMLVGSTGNSTGPHLHFEVRINGKCVNPTEYLPN